VIVADLDQAAPRLQGLFDAIVYGDVLEHLNDPLPVLVALARALAADGRVIVSVPNVAHLWVRFSLALGRWDYADRGILDRTHLRFFTKRSFGAFLRDAGLSVEEMVATPVPLPLVVPARFHGPVLDAVHTLSAAAARAWKGGLAYQLVAVCRRASPEVR
jgi:SAM-dependent methyltransferase